MALMQKCGLLVVDADGNVNPHKNVTRAECAVSVVRIARASLMGAALAETKIILTVSSQPIIINSGLILLGHIVIENICPLLGLCRVGG